jgi:hypothetical protein
MSSGSTCHIAWGWSSWLHYHDRISSVDGQLSLNWHFVHCVSSYECRIHCAPYRHLHLQEAWLFKNLLSQRLRNMNYFGMFLHWNLNECCLLMSCFNSEGCRNASDCEHMYSLQWQLCPVKTFGCQFQHPDLKCVTNRLLLKKGRLDMTTRWSSRWWIWYVVTLPLLSNLRVFST